MSDKHSKSALVDALWEDKFPGSDALFQLTISLYIYDSLCVLTPPNTAGVLLNMSAPGPTCILSQPLQQSKSQNI